MICVHGREESTCVGCGWVQVHARNEVFWTRFGPDGYPIPTPHMRRVELSTNPAAVYMREYRARKKAERARTEAGIA